MLSRHPQLNSDIYLIKPPPINRSDLNFENLLRAKFVETAKKYIGIPYNKKLAFLILIDSFKRKVKKYKFILKVIFFRTFQLFYIVIFFLKASYIFFSLVST